MKPTQTNIPASATELIKSVPFQAATLSLWHAYQAQLAGDEDLKHHPLIGFKLSPAEWKSMKSHLTDGGGVVDDTDLRTVLLVAIQSDDQDTFWKELPHLFKSWMKQKGSITPVPGAPGAVMTGPVPATQPVSALQAQAAPQAPQAPSQPVLEAPQ